MHLSTLLNGSLILGLGVSNGRTHCKTRLILDAGTLKASSREGSKMPVQIALDKGYVPLKDILTPEIHHPVPDFDQAKLEIQLHALMRSVAGEYVRLLKSP